MNNEFTDKELQLAYALFLRDYAEQLSRNTTDDAELMRAIGIDRPGIGYNPPFYCQIFETTESAFTNSDKSFIYTGKAWLRAIRQSLFLTLDAVATANQMKASALRNIELNEESGQITLKQLANISDLYGYDLKYELRPRTGQKPPQKAFQKILPAAYLHPFLKKCHPHKRAYALAAIATKVLNTPKFRRDSGWARMERKRKYR